MIKHTPGPWTVGVHGYKLAGKTAVLDSSRPFRMVADASVGGTGGPSDSLYCYEEREANARLIAAAPDLIEAAKAALISLGAANDVMGGGHSGGEEYYVEVRNRLRAAIAKAEGK